MQVSKALKAEAIKRRLGIFDVNAALCMLIFRS
jgi:hypothetical protein